MTEYILKCLYFVKKKTVRDWSSLFTRALEQQLTKTVNKWPLNMKKFSTSLVIMSI